MGHGGNKTQRVDIIDSYDPRITGRAAQKGTLFRYIPAVGEPTLLIKTDDGFSVNWNDVGGGAALPVTVATVKNPDGQNIDIGNAPADIDGETLSPDDVVLLVDQTDPAENGVYTYNGAGNAMTRAAGWNTATDFIPGRQVYTDGGDTQADLLWANADYVPTLDASPIRFINVSASGGMATDFSNAQPSAVDLDIGGNQLKNVADPTDQNDAATKDYVDNNFMRDDLSNNVPAAASLDMNGNTVVNLQDPGNDQDAATKKYVDNSIPAPVIGAAFVIPYFDGSGNLSSVNPFVKNNYNSQGSVMIGAQFNGGTLIAQGDGCLAIGSVNLANTFVDAQGQGTVAIGAVQGADGFIRSQGVGTLAIGCAYGGGSLQMDTFTRGSVIIGHVDGAGVISAAASYGALCQGYAVGASLYAPGHGSHTHGHAIGSGLIQTLGIGSHAHGYAFTNATIQAVGIGSHASGYAIGGGGPDSGIYASANGSFAIGYTIDLNSRIRAEGIGSFASGYSVGGQSVVAWGIAAFSHGSFNESFGDYSATLGIGLLSNAWGCLVTGSFNQNISFSPNNFVSTEPGLIVGGGSDDANRFDAFRVDKDGSVTESGSNRVPIRILTGDSVASARTDRKFVLNSADPAASLTLPPGEEGLTFRAGVAGANTAVWSLIPDGADIVDANLSGLFGGTTVEMTFTSGTWYGA